MIKAVLIYRYKILHLIALFDLLFICFFTVLIKHFNAFHYMLLNNTININVDVTFNFYLVYILNFFFIVPYL